MGDYDTRPLGLEESLVKYHSGYQKILTEIPYIGTQDIVRRVV